MMTETEIQSKTAQLAYFFFLERQEKGLPGDEANDWAKAEEAMQNELSSENADYLDAGAPLTLIKGIGPKAAGELEAVGIESVAHLAELSLKELSARAPRLASRAKSGRWIEQSQAFSTNAN
jgi:predicted flap endonuclease-1-like 5' DNA nuclease